MTEVVAPPDVTVVTGIGVLAPTGDGLDEYWTATRQGRSGLAPLTRHTFTSNPYPLRVAGQVARLPRERLPARVLPQTDTWTQQGLVQAAAALDDAGIVPSEFGEFAIGVATASSAGGVEFGQRQIQSLWHDGPRHVGAFQAIAWFYAATTGQISIGHGLRGQCDAVVTEGAGGLDSLGLAAASLSDDTRVMVCGGTDSAMSPYGVVCQLASGLLSEEEEPSRAFRPFAPDASGYVPGEGGAMFVVESLSSARARGVRIYGEIAGYAATFDPGPGRPGPPALSRAVRQALDDAGVSAADVDVVFADAYGVVELDRQEAVAIGEVFGPYGVPVTAPKTAVGRLYSGGGALDAATALLAMQEGCIPPTINVAAADPGYEIDLVTSPRETVLRTAVVLARGYGGFNAALVLRGAREPAPPPTAYQTNSRTTGDPS